MMTDDKLHNLLTNSMSDLELHAVLEEVAAHALSVPGREKVIASQPESDVDAIQAGLDLVSQLLEFVGLDGALGLSDLIPLEGMLERIDNPAVILEPEEILAVGDMLAACATIGNRLGRLEDRYALLRAQGEKLIPLRSLRSRIAQVFDEHGLVRSSASPELSRIRDRIRSVRQRIHKRLEGIVRDRDLARIVQEDYVTMRNDRYVVLLRPEFKGMLDGIVHDHSRSGASVYVEPLEVVEHNNEVASLLDEEREEIRTILKELTDNIREAKEELLLDYHTLSFLDAYQARALYGRETSSVAPEIGDNGFRIKRARHPLLIAAGIHVVPMDVVQDSDTLCTVISGANMGGKTVALKIAGLFPLMARCALLLPADEGTRIQPFARIMADIGEEQDIRGHVSSFSGHMARIKEIMDKAGAEDLVLLDELGGATDPDEGSALAMAIMDELARRRTRTVVTTHLTQLKAYALGKTDARNVSVEFHPETLEPTYKLLYDLPGESHAIETAERMGMPQTVIAAARSYANVAAGGSTRLLQTLRTKLSDVEELRRELEEKQRVLDAELADLRESREKVIDELRLRARDTLRKAEKEVADLVQSLKEGKIRRGPRPRELFKALREQVAADLGTSLERETEPPAVGTPVKIVSLGRQGTIKSVLDRRRVEVRAGNVTVVASVDDLVPMGIAPPKKNTFKEPPIGVDIPFATPQWEVNVIGHRVEDALPVVEKALNSAILGGLPSLRIIHGKGTGRLRKAVWDYLSEHSLVRSYRIGEPREGGEGATIVEVGSD